MSATAAPTSLDRASSSASAVLQAHSDGEGDEGHSLRRTNHLTETDSVPSEDDDECEASPISIVADGRGGGRKGRDENGEEAEAEAGPAGGAREQPEAALTPPPPRPPPPHGDDEEAPALPPSGHGGTGRRWRRAASPRTTSSSDVYSDAAPPGPEAMTAWLTRDHLPDGGAGAGEDSSSSSSPDDEEEATARNEGNEDNKDVRRFVGPMDVGPARALRRRRLEHVRSDGGPRGTTSSGEPFETVSYKLLDTPVWHNRTVSIGDGTLDDEQRLTTLLRRIWHCHWICRWSRFASSGRGGCCRRRHSRTKDGEGDSPIREYLRNERFVARITLFCIGVSMSIVGFAVERLADLLLTSKLNWVIGLGASSATHGFGAFIGMNLLFGFLAFLPVAIRPPAAGSGISEAKAILNGIILPRCTELRTGFCKGIGVVFSVAASLPVGLEGPLIFLGLCLGENSQRFLPNSYAPLKSHRSRRDLAAVGTASGVAAAFLAPVGGVIFAMEEGSSFWSVVLSWRSFGAACVTVIFLYGWGAAASATGAGIDVTTFSRFDGMPGRRMMAPMVTFRMYDYLAFALMGVAGGVVGACFIEVNRAISVWRRRRRRVTSRFTWKCGEVLLVTAVASALLWWLPRAYVVCGPVPPAAADDVGNLRPSGTTTADDIGNLRRLVQTTDDNENYYRQFGCPDGQYNHLATLLLNPAGSIGLNMLFWEPQVSFTAASCLIAGTVYLLVLLVLFGTSISMGIFIPFLYVGACYGRAVGVALGLGDVTRTYAMVGAIAMLTGVARVLISLTAIMVTTTGLPYMVTPFMVATIFAKASGKAVFGKDGIYDVILQTRDIPFLEAEPPQEVRYRGLRAEDVMSTSLVTLEPEQSVGVLIRYLRTYNFADFPVVDPSRGGAFLGIVARSDILELLSHPGLFYSPRSNGDGIPHSRRALQYDLLLHKHHGGPTVESVEESLTEDDLEKVIDLTPYLEIAHYTFNMLGSVERAFELFRTLGLRTLVVTGGPHGRPVGVITRYDLRLLEEVDMDDARLGRSREAAV